MMLWNAPCRRSAARAGPATRKLPHSESSSWLRMPLHSCWAANDPPISWLQKWQRTGRYRVISLWSICFSLILWFFSHFLCLSFPYSHVSSHKIPFVCVCVCLVQTVTYWGNKKLLCRDDCAPLIKHLQSDLIAVAVELTPSSLPCVKKPLSSMNQRRERREASPRSLKSNYIRHQTTPDTTELTNTQDRGFILHLQQIFPFSLVEIWIISGWMDPPGRWRDGHAGLMLWCGIFLTNIETIVSPAVVSLRNQT